MGSIVADVLQSTGKLAKENIVLKVDDLKRKLEDIKLEVQENVKNRYVDFIPEYVKLDNTINNIREFASEYDVLHNQIEKEIKPQMISSVTEFNDVVEDLKRIKKLKSVAWNLSLLHQHLEDAKSSLLQGAYLKAAHCLEDFESIMKLIDSKDQKEITVLSTIRVEFIVTKEDLIYRTETLWREKIGISSTMDGKKKCFSIKFNNISDEVGRELLMTLQLLKQLKPILKEFGKLFLYLVCDSVLLKTVKTRSLPDASAFTLTITKDHCPEPSEAFEILKEIFIFLHERFFKLPVTPDDNECVQSAMKEFGLAIGEEFSTFVIEKCLKVAVPKQSKQLESFHKQITAAENFCNVLQELEFLSPSNKLLTFIHDVDTLPVDKMAKNLLGRARSLMKKSLHQTVIVGSESLPVPVEGDGNDLNEISKTQNGLSKFTFSFPRCQISESVKELTQLFLDVKEETKNIGSPHSLRLYYASRNICELYCCVVPTYHKEEIENIPQQTAIFHNNCMYLAHCLCTLGTQYEAELQHVLDVKIPLTFVDLVPEIRVLGIEVFLSQMRKQKKQLLQLLQEQQAYGSMMDGGSVSKAEKAIRQCLCQLQLLKKVWSEVLPIDVYFKAIGTLFNTCLEEVILRISSMEDIAAEAASQLDSTFAIFLKQGPDLFKVTSVDKRNFVHYYVRQWFKFQELQLILSASMQEIVDRWASGKGPLATHFTSEEVKHLIRALFQNTERRAASLAKIR